MDKVFKKELEKILSDKITKQKDICESINYYRMYIFINNDLKMGKGKISAQVGHVVQSITEAIIGNYYENKIQKLDQKIHNDLFNDYCSWGKCGCPKIVLKATLEELENIYEKHHDEIKFVHDFKLKSLTAIAFIPMTEDKMIYDVKKHKLL
jgi:peptidyl-tRNA hydrolase